MEMPSAIASKRPSRTVSRLDVNFHYYDEDADFSTCICYFPVVKQAAGGEAILRDYYGQRKLSSSEMPESLCEKLTRLRDYVAAEIVELPDLEIGDEVFPAPPVHVVEIEVTTDGIMAVRFVAPMTTAVNMKKVRVSSLSAASQRLIQNMLPTYEQLAWDHFRTTLERPPVKTLKKKVFVSYRRTKPEYKLFADAVAHRLGREGFLPWLDDWEIHAGDSIVREMGNGFRDVHAVIIILTEDYPAGKWAREVLETAIAKRVEERIRVIPVKYEDATIPELLRSLSYVDCTDHADGVFESQFRRIIDALNNLELNPYT